MGTDYPSCDPGLYAREGFNYLTQIEQPFCAPCPLGHYCIGGDDDHEPIPCPAGYQGTFIGMSHKEEACKDCPPGTSCPKGTKIATPCKPGSYSRDGGEKCVTCTKGWYCPGGTDTPLKCEDGWITESDG